MDQILYSRGGGIQLNDSKIAYQYVDTTPPYSPVTDLYVYTEHDTSTTFIIYKTFNNGVGPFDLYFGWDTTNTYFWDYTYTGVESGVNINTSGASNPPNSGQLSPAYYTATLTDTYNNTTYTYDNVMVFWFW